jgi:hypothetical protein
MKGKLQFACTILENRATKKVRNYHSKGNNFVTHKQHFQAEFLSRLCGHKTTAVRFIFTIKFEQIIRGKCPYLHLKSQQRTCGALKKDTPRQKARGEPYNTQNKIAHQKKMSENIR